jgi:hypothetical protein
MKLRLVRERTVAELQSNIMNNLGRYRAGNFDHLLIDPSLSFEGEIEFIESEVSALKAPKEKDKFEAHNCSVMLRALPKLTPYQAADERVWVMLSHTSLLSHARERWPIPKNDADAIHYISTHFFARNARQLERNNVGSRLWWMGHLCSRVKGIPLNTSLEVLLYKSDVRANIVERPTTAQGVPLFAGLIRRLEKSYKGPKKLFERRVFRKLMAKLNGIGGYKLLDALDAKAIEHLIDRTILEDLKLSDA